MKEMPYGDGTMRTRFGWIRYGWEGLWEAVVMTAEKKPGHESYAGYYSMGMGPTPEAAIEMAWPKGKQE